MILSSSLAAARDAPEEEPERMRERDVLRQARARMNVAGHGARRLAGAPLQGNDLPVCRAVVVSASQLPNFESYKAACANFFARSLRR
jgi:hypothetical protein